LLIQRRRAVHTSLPSPTSVIILLTLSGAAAGQKFCGYDPRRFPRKKRAQQNYEYTP
jgi:hypothetical protein